jgi:iron(III) transport system permease protein
MAWLGLLLACRRRRAGAVRRRGGDLVHAVQRAGAAHRVLSLGNFTQLFERSYRPLTNTLMLATLAACGATLIGVPIGYVITRHRSRLSALIDIVATSPFAVAGTVLGIGMVMAFNSGFLILTGTWLIMVLAYMVRKLPFSVRSAGAILHQIDPSLEEASINLGVPPALTFRASRCR